MKKLPLFIMGVAEGYSLAFLKECRHDKKLLEKQITRAETRIDISKLPKGMYFLRLQHENDVKVAKIIKD